VVKEQLAAYGADPDGSGSGQDIATQPGPVPDAGAGYPAVGRHGGFVDGGSRRALLPMTDDPRQTHVVVDTPEGERKAIHFQGVWVRYPPSCRALDRPVGAEEAKPAPACWTRSRGGRRAVRPVEPGGRVGTVLLFPGMRDGMRKTDAPSSDLADHQRETLRGMADACLTGIGVEPARRPSAGTTARDGARMTVSSTRGSCTRVRPRTCQCRCPGGAVC